MTSEQTEIGKQELRGVLEPLPHTAEWKEALSTLLSINTLSELLYAKEGKLRKVGEDEVAAVKEMVAEVRTNGPDALKDETEADLVAQLLQLLGSARAREPEYHKRLHGSAGLKSGSQNATTLDADSLWAGLKIQRLGRAVPDEQRAAPTLVKELWEALTDPQGRRLASLQLAKVKSVNDEKETEEAKGGGRKRPTNTAGMSALQLGVKRSKVAFTALAAVGSTESDSTLPGAPHRNEDEGKMKVQGKEVQLDCTYLEAMEAHDFVVDRMLAGDPTEAGKAFDRYWSKLAKQVSGNGRHRTTLASGMIQAMRNEESESESVRQTLLKMPAAKAGRTERDKGKSVAWAVDRRPAGVTAGKGSPARKPTALEKKKAEEKKKKEEEKKRKRAAANKGKEGKANTSGQICHTYRTTGECPYGDKCIHKHLEEEDQSDEDDVRER